MWNIFLPKLFRKKRIFCLNARKYISINFYIQEKQLAKYENLGILPFKTISIISQRKAFCRQRIPQPSCTRKEIADRDIIKTFKNDVIKIMPIRIRSGSPTQISKRKQFSQFRWTSTKIISTQRTWSGYI